MQLVKLVHEEQVKGQVMQVDEAVSKKLPIPQIETQFVPLR
jgi:hypothetical protein